ncbi:hypothetical protein WG922_16025 [Ramlibacter sp. AN1015]|uniref:hypothetical protein n=1 Tax=Ramlibacter sp. AN1015 TaxID=3133428 RepID=UPI0030C212DC
MNSADESRSVKVTHVLRLTELANQPLWDGTYTPGIAGTRVQAPSKSGTATAVSQKLGRVVVSHGAAEVYTALALYHPNTIALFEEHVLNPYAAQHPLASHPVHGQVPWPSTKGTVAIAQELGLLRRHASVLHADGGDTLRIYWPYIGDHLVCLAAEQGPYAVEWDIKKSTGDHGKPGPATATSKVQPRAIARAQCRDEIYQGYMKELGIPIKRVAADDLDFTAATNLVRLWWSHGREPLLPKGLLQALLPEFNSTLSEGKPLTSLYPRLRKHRIAWEDARDAFYVAVWRRQVRVSLFDPILDDKPMRPEKLDILDAYAHLFAR